MIIALFLIHTVLPDITAMMHQNPSTLPSSTQMLLHIDHWLCRWYPLLLASIMCTMISLKSLCQHHYYTKKLSQHMLDNLPLLKHIRQHQRLNQLCYLMTIALKQHLPLIFSLKLAKDSQSHIKTQENLEVLIEALQAGHPLPAALMLSRDWPPIMVEIMSVGAENANLAACFEHLQHYFYQQLEHHICQLEQWLPPILLLLTASMVGSLMIALYLPLFNLGDTL